MNKETLKVLTNWTERTEMILRLQMRKHKIKRSGALEGSLSSHVKAIADGMIESQVEFLVRGRFVDMGVGRSLKFESRQTNADLIREKSGGKPRKPKQWYSRAYYGRINALQGILGYQMMEAAINAVKGPLESSK